VQTPFRNLRILPSKWELSKIESDLHLLSGRDYRLKEAIEKIDKSYDFIIVDCPASLGLLTINALVACREVLIPVQCEFYALEGIARFIDTIDFVKNRLNYFLDISGIIVTMYSKTRLAAQVIREVNNYFPGKIFNTVIPKNISLAEAPAVGKPINEYDPESKGAIAYRELTKEIIENRLRAQIEDFPVLKGRFFDFWRINSAPKHAVKKH
jgi:chromosome partitioning protein